MESVIEEFALYLFTVKKMAANTIASYKRDLKKMASFMEERGVLDIRDVTVDRLSSYAMHLQEENLASASIVRNITSIKAFFRYLLENGNIEENPAEDLRAPKIEKKAPRVLSGYEVEELLSTYYAEDAKGKRDRAILELMYATGLKASEIIELELSNIDMSLNCLRLSGDRVIPYGKMAKDALNEYLLNARGELVSSVNPEETKVFVNYQGLPMSRQGLWKLIKSYAKRAGISTDISPDCLRHSFAIHLIENGADVNALQEMMGYKNAGTLSKYVRKKEKNKDPYEWARMRNQ